MLRIVPVYTVQVNYKSGISMRFDCFDFKLRDSVYSWTAASTQNKPVTLGADNVESVWQVGVYKVIKWGK
jgi:hypothetical protein